MMNISSTATPSANPLISYVDQWMKGLLEVFRVSDGWTAFIKFLVLAVCIICVSLLLQWLFRNIFRIIFRKVAKSTSIAFLKYTVQNKVPMMLATIAPYTFIRSAIPYLFSDYSSFVSPVTNILDILYIYAVIRLVMNIAKSFTDGLQEKPALKDKPMHSFLQVIQIILFIIGAIITFAILTDTSISSVFIGLGGASALMMFIFQDSIKGFIGSIQLVFNDMVKLGDWITMSKYDADGTVLDISLTTVKIQNFDMTVSTVPTNALITDAFQNWTPMQESGGRRFKKSIYIKQDTISFVPSEDLKEFREIDYLKSYLAEKETEYAKRNANCNTSLPIGHHQITNNELYIAYLQSYLENHPRVKQENIVMVRQMKPTANGLEIELYAFTNTAALTEHEAISTEIFNHMIGVTKYFKLYIFEYGSDTDVIPIDILSK